VVKNDNDIDNTGKDDDDDNPNDDCVCCQVAVTVSNKVYTWGCHPHNLRFAANAMRRSRQMGQATPSGDGMEMFHLPVLVDTTYLRSRVVQVRD